MALMRALVGARGQIRSTTFKFYPSELETLNDSWNEDNRSHYAPPSLPKRAATQSASVRCVLLS